jgi:cephalosporin-C deacetylase-like acetyl esterase
MQRSFRLLSPACLVTVLLAGTAAVVAADSPATVLRKFCPIPARGRIEFATVAEEQVPERFRLSPHRFPSQARLQYENGAVRKYRVQFPSPVTTDIEINNTVHAEYFQPAGEGPFPACIVLHILGGDFPLSRMIANHLAQHGVAALFVKMPYYGERRSPGSRRRMISQQPQETVEGMTQGVLDIRRGAAWLASRPEVDPARLGITGISLGGIMSALAGACEPRFSRVASYLAGGNFADLIWSYQVSKASEFRQHWQESGGTKESFARLIRQIDPATYGHLLRNRQVLLVAARHDEIIAPESAIALWKSMGEQPRLVWLNSGHYSAAWYLPRELIRIDLFFNAPENTASRNHTPRRP